MTQVKEGDVIRVRNWPETQGQRFTVTDVVDAPGSKYPVQVHATSRDGQFRAFPADLCSPAKQRRV